MRAACAVLHKVDDSQCEVVNTDERYERVYIRFVRSRERHSHLKNMLHFIQMLIMWINMAEEAKSGGGKHMPNQF